MTRLVVAGAGAIGRRHVAHIAEHHRLDLAAIIDPDPAVSNLADAPRFDRLQDAEIDADGIIIATPTPDHEPTFNISAARGWGALVEKPIASDLAGATRMIDTACKAGVPLLLGHHRRFHPRVMRLKELLASGIIGQPVLVALIWAVKKPEGYFDMAWRQGVEGAPIRMNVSHELDLLQFLFGEVTGVAGLGANPVRQAARVESGGVVLSFASGLTATIAFADTTPTPFGFEHGTGENPNIATTGENAMRIMGSKGAIEFPSLRVWSGARDWSEAPKPTETSCPEGTPLILQLEHFARVLKGEERPINDGQAARRTLELTLEVERLTLPAGV